MVRRAVTTRKARGINQTEQEPTRVPAPDAHGYAAELDRLPGVPGCVQGGGAVSVVKGVLRGAHRRRRAVHGNGPSRTSVAGPMAKSRHVVVPDHPGDDGDDREADG